MKKMLSVVAILAVFAGSVFSAPAVKKEAPAPKKQDVAPQSKEVKSAAGAEVKPAAGKTGEVSVADFEESKAKGTSSSYIGDASGMEETSGDVNVFAHTAKKAKTGKQSASLEYTQKPVKENKFAQITLSSEKPMGSNNAISFYLFTEKGKTAISINLFDNKWKKWSSQAINADKSEWVLVTIKDSEFVTDARAGKWDNINKVQIIVKGSGVFYFDDLRFVKAAK